MKILITVATYYPDVDGVQNVTEYQAENLVKMGNSVTVVASNERGKYITKEKHNGVNIIRFNAYNSKTLHHGDKKKYQDLVLQLASHCDVMINVCLESFAADWLLPILDKFNCKKVLINHGMQEFGLRSKKNSGLLDKAKEIIKDIRWGIFYKKYWNNIANYDEYVFLHEMDYARLFFIQHGIPRSKTHVIYNAVPNIFFDKCRKKNQIINVGTFGDRKNQKLCLKSFYKASTKDYSLVLIGRPNNRYYNKLLSLNKHLSERYGAKDVKILSNVDRKETIDLIKQSRIYLLTSKIEKFPISLIESMASGSAFVSTDVGIVKNFPGGYVCDKKSEIIDKINLLIKKDPTYQGAIARSYAIDNFDEKQQVKKLESILKK